MYTLNVLIKVPLSDFKCSYFEFKFWHSNFEIVRPSLSITPCIDFRNLTFSGNTVLCLFFHQIAAEVERSACVKIPVYFSDNTVSGDTPKNSERK